VTRTEARELCRSLFLDTLDSLRVAPRLRSMVSLSDGALRIGADSYPLPQNRPLRIVAFGKAAREMAETVAVILAPTPLSGIVVAPRAAAGVTAGEPAAPARSGFEYFQAGHPYPDAASAKAADAVLDFLENLSPRELILFLISGGGSALLEKALDPSVSIDDMRRLHELLVTSGANIQEMNTVRKHFSAVKGGRLAERAAPAMQATIYVSDVPDHLPSAVASGPTMPDETTVADCAHVLARYGLSEKLPASIRLPMESKKVPETPKPGDACFAQSGYYCLMSNREAIQALREGARSKGVRTAEERCDDWPVERAAEYLLGRLQALGEKNPGTPLLLVNGGELSLPVPHGAAGRGGRNQAFVLSCVPKIAGKPVVVLSGGTDGIDGSSPAAGAIADGETAARAASLGADPKTFADQFDSYGFFEKLNDAIVTGPTGTNVRDVRLLLAYS
jgi:glycerate 2-kinase